MRSGPAARERSAGASAPAGPWPRRSPPRRRLPTVAASPSWASARAVARWWTGSCPAARCAALQFWSLGADPNALQTALAPNRWRLPPGTVDPKDSAVEENAEAVSRGILGGGVANEPPAVVVVVASASEMVGAPLVTLEAVARLKDGPSQRGWFNVGGSQGITHRGPALIVAAMTPFAFEGPRKSADAVEALLAAQKRADAVTIVPQEALTGGVAANGDPLTVAEVTELADATAQWSAWTILEMFKSPAWIGLDGAASESTPESKSRNRAEIRNALSPGTFRALVAGRPKNAKLGWRVRGRVRHEHARAQLRAGPRPERGDPCRRRRRARRHRRFSEGGLRQRRSRLRLRQTQATLTEAAVRARPTRSPSWWAWTCRRS